MWPPCHDDHGSRGTDMAKGEWVVVDLSAITRPVGDWWPPRRTGWKCCATAAWKPAPCRRRSRSSRACDVPAAAILPARTPGPARTARTAGADGAPDDDVGRHVGRHPRRGRRRHPAQGRHRPVGDRLRLTRQGRGRHGPQPCRPRRRAERSDRHRQGGHRPRRPPGRLLAGRHVRLPDRGLPPVQDLASIVAFGSRWTRWPRCR